jgi:chloramphenicol O-acetyltransferase type A
MRVVDPKTTSRAKAYELWIKSPMPMVTMTKTYDITHLRRLSRRRGVKLNMLMCYAIVRAASKFKEFYLLPVGDKLVEYDHLAINTIVMTTTGGINTCDIPYSEDIHTFANDYLRLTAESSRATNDLTLEGSYMVIGSSALTKCELDSVTNLYAGWCNNPFVVWSKYRKRLFRTIVPLSFQFHHTQMDGPISTAFMNELQRVMSELDY